MKFSGTADAAAGRTKRTGPYFWREELTAAFVGASSVLAQINPSHHSKASQDGSDTTSSSTKWRKRGPEKGTYYFF
jgi:hypothetical protein